MSEGIQARILGLIESGQFPPGSRFLPERDLSKMFNATLWSVHASMTELKEAGIFVGRGNQGTFVNADLPVDRMRRLRKCAMMHVKIMLSRCEHFGKAVNEVIIPLIEKELTSRNYAVSYESIPQTEAAWREFLGNSSNENLRAIVMLPDYEDWDLFRACVRETDFQGGHLFCFNRGLGDESDRACNYISIDTRHEGRLATDCLVRQGVNDVMFLSNIGLQRYWINERLRGVAYAAGVCGVPVRTEMNERGAKEFPKVLKHLRKAGRRTGVIAANDQVAVDLMDYLGNYDMTPGRDFSLVAFDNNPALRAYGLTTVEPNLPVVGKVVAEAIDAMPSMVKFGCHSACKILSHLVERSSVIRGS